MKLEELNFKTYVTPEQSKELQKLLFEKGGKWKFDGSNIINTDKPFLIVINGRLSYHDDIYYFVKLKHKTVSFSDAMKLIEQVDVKPKIKKVDLKYCCPMCKCNDIYGSSYYDGKDIEIFNDKCNKIVKIDVYFNECKNCSFKWVSWS